MLGALNRSFPPASEREARMDDPTLRCENDAGNETRLRGFPFPSGDPYFFSAVCSALSPACSGLTASRSQIKLTVPLS